MAVEHCVAVATQRTGPVQIQIWMSCGPGARHRQIQTPVIDDGRRAVVDMGTRGRVHEDLLPYVRSSPARVGEAVGVIAAGLDHLYHTHTTEKETTMDTITPELVVEKRTLVGEGSLWDPQEKVLYWIDILSHELYIWDPATRTNRTIPTAQAIGTVVKRARGGLVVALHNGFAYLDLDTEKITPITDPERTVPANRFNDGKCDPAGRFWAGTMAFDCDVDAGALYCLDTDGTVTERLRPVTISNGIVWTADTQTMYYICTRANTVRAFDYDVDSGAIDNERVVITNQGEGGFDGMSIDAEDKLWVAVYGGWAVRRYDPTTGGLMRELRLPFECVTSCAFGGEGLDELYVTSAVQGFDAAKLDEQPLAGCLVKVDPGVQGVAAFSYAG